MQQGGEAKPDPAVEQAAKDAADAAAKEAEAAAKVKADIEKAQADADAAEAARVKAAAELPADGADVVDKDEDEDLDPLSIGERVHRVAKTLEGFRERLDAHVMGIVESIVGKAEGGNDPFAAEGLAPLTVEASVGDVLTYGDAVLTRSEDGTMLVAGPDYAKPVKFDAGDMLSAVDSWLGQARKDSHKREMALRG